MLVALDHTAQPNVWDEAQQATLIFHTGGAIVWIGVTVYSEIYTLIWATKVKLTDTEKSLRSVLVALALVAGVIYLVCSSISASTLGLCCDDEYRPITMDNVEKARANGAYEVAQENLKLMQYATFTPNAQPPLYQGMYNTASGSALAWRMLEFWSEACAGFFMLLNLLVIYFFSTARDIDLPEDLELA